MCTDLSKQGRCEGKLRPTAPDGSREGARMRICDGDDRGVAVRVLEGGDRHWAQGIQMDTNRAIGMSYVVIWWPINYCDWCGKGGWSLAVRELYINRCHPQLRVLWGVKHQIVPAQADPGEGSYQGDTHSVPLWIRIRWQWYRQRRINVHAAQWWGETPWETWSWVGYDDGETIGSWSPRVMQTATFHFQGVGTNQGEAIEGRFYHQRGLVVSVQRKGWRNGNHTIVVIVILQGKYKWLGRTQGYRYSSRWSRVDARIAPFRKAIYVWTSLKASQIESRDS